ncbi:MAG: diguanylate cyclase [Burkholderiales bacterium]|nr:diguanylate cyclase [Burkholderiales bacterium]
MPAVPIAPFPAAGPPDLAHESARPADAWPERALPGPLVWRMVLAAVLALGLAGALAGWWLARAAVQEALQRLEVQQNDEVEMFARLLSGKIEQNQKMLRSVADGITPDMLDLPATLEWQLQQGLPAAQFFDALFVVRSDGALRVHQRQGRFQRAVPPELPVRVALERTLAGGRPQVDVLPGGSVDDARLLLTMPLHRDNGALLGVVAGMLRLQSPGLLSASLALPQRPDTRLLVFARDGTILAHSNPQRVLGRVQDEPGLADALARWPTTSSDGLAAGAGTTQVLPDAMVSLAGMPLVQWTVARVSDTRALLSPLEGGLRSAWGQVAVALAGLALGLAAVLLWLAQPLARLRLQAQRLLEAGPDAAAPPAPGRRSSGEVGVLAGAFEGLLARHARQEGQMRTLRAQWRAALEHAPLGLAVTRGGEIDSAGQHLCQTLGYAPHDLEGRPVDLLYTAQVRDGIAALAPPPCRGPVRVDEALSLRRKDGSAVWLQAQGWPVHEGEPEAGMLWLLQDLTLQRLERRSPAWGTTHDALTGLENRQGLEQRLAAWPAALQPQPARAPGAPPPTVALLFLDLDHFTVINDAVGHEAGDQILCHVARLLVRQMQGAGWVARLGGDEFAVLLPDCSEAYAAAVAERLRSAVQALEPTVQGRSFALGASLGLVVLEDGSAGADVGAILHAADMACYDAKRAGRNCVRRRPVQRAGAPAP